MVRVSDDFYPRNPASSHPHIAACAYNGFFLSAIAHVRARTLLGSILICPRPGLGPRIMPKMRVSSDRSYSHSESCCGTCKVLVQKWPQQTTKRLRNG